ncbi:IPIL1 protein, partial [Penelope pileata]|nr:IPIL1 protein [Penelope pileata]
VEHVMNGLLQVFTTLCSGSSFPVLQPVIGVGSAFEGWSPLDDAVSHLLVPVQAPHGHLFHLELGSDGEVLARNSRIRVELQCTCTSEQQGAELLCFLHHSEEELSRNQDPSLLDTLCTGSYLDAQKTASWFRELVVAVWAATPQAHGHRLRLLPSSRSCKLQLTDISSGEKLLVELLFGVRQEDSDIFLSSHNTDAGFTASTAWPQSCAVAEKKFFQYVARNVPEGSTHLNCLGLFAHILVGIGFSTYAIKTVVMHLLTTIPVWSWSEMDFLCRLDDILRYLHCCLQEKRLTHFLLGNETVPEEVVLPQAFQTASPLNLFQHLEREPAAHSQALEEFRQL